MSTLRRGGIAAQNPADLPSRPRPRRPLCSRYEEAGMVASQWGGMMALDDGVFPVRVPGEIDAASAARFRQYLLGAISMAHRELRIDLRGVEQLDSSAVHALLAAHTAAEARDVQLSAEAHGLPLRVIELTGLTFLLRGRPEPLA